MKDKLLVALAAYAMVVGVASSVMMVWVFLNEAFFGMGVLYYEPTLWIAVAEFFMSVSGTALLFAFMLSYLSRRLLT